MNGGTDVKYIVNICEIWINRVEVEADNIRDAIALALEDDGTHSLGIEYSDRCTPAVSCVEDEDGTILEAF
jgi:hypothetical protein